MQEGPVVASAWLDRKIVMMCTNTQPSSQGIVQRRQRDGTRQPVTCPESIISYNNNMGGVDGGDQLRAITDVG